MGSAFKGGTKFFLGFSVSFCSSPFSLAFSFFTISFLLFPVSPFPFRPFFFFLFCFLFFRYEEEEYSNKDTYLVCRKLKKGGVWERMALDVSEKKVKERKKRVGKGRYGGRNVFVWKERGRALAEHLCFGGGACLVQGRLECWGRHDRLS